MLYFSLLFEDIFTYWSDKNIEIIQRFAVIIVTIRCILINVT